MPIRTRGRSLSTRGVIEISFFDFDHQNQKQDRQNLKKNNFFICFLKLCLWGCHLVALLFIFVLNRYFINLVKYVFVIF